eukprot:TRINITY_DN7764_c0_g1_i6.p1 TRINITY_DN7764_c0_g1~~TRINITY_DN7764_c0_g1_i6.p1  ORF type:complete len:154 (+),score=49.92 TRINITY_DN7764_c0_g1_i6:1180-1641(+)
MSSKEFTDADVNAIFETEASESAKGRDDDLYLCFRKGIGALLTSLCIVAHNRSNLADAYLVRNAFDGSEAVLKLSGGQSTRIGHKKDFSRVYSQFSDLLNADPLRKLVDMLVNVALETFFCRLFTLMYKLLRQEENSFVKTTMWILCFVFDVE